MADLLDQRDVHQDLVKNLVLLTTGIDYSTRDSLISLWTDPRYFDVDKFVDSMGDVPAEFLQPGFLLLKPIANLVEKPINLMENLHRDECGRGPLTGWSSAPIDTERFCPSPASETGKNPGATLHFALS